MCTVRSTLPLWDFGSLVGMLSDLVDRFSCACSFDSGNRMRSFGGFLYNGIG